jgi:iron complex transport system ATP-binding protein
VTELAVSGVGVAYDGVPVLRGVTLEVATEEWVGIIGPNGAGKSTLLRAVAGLVPAAGQIRLDGTAVAELPGRERALRMALVPQRPIIPAGMTVADYVLLGRNPHIPYLGSERRRDVDVVVEAMESLDLVGFRNRRLETLSGGELQRAVLARALAQEAPLLLLEEPTAALDMGHQLAVLQLVDDLRRRRRLTVVSALHDLTLAAQFCDRLVLLAEGRIVADGQARSVLTEQAIRDHDGAEVKVLDDPEGGLVIIPLRRPVVPSVVPEDEVDEAGEARP